MAELEEAAAQGAQPPSQLIFPKTVTREQTAGSVWRS